VDRYSESFINVYSHERPPKAYVANHFNSSLVAQPQEGCRSVVDRASEANEPTSNESVAEIHAICKSYFVVRRSVDDEANVRNDIAWV
jgi:hypothetical protein